MTLSEVTPPSRELDILLGSFVTGLRAETMRAQLAPSITSARREEIEDAIQTACKCFLDEADGITDPGRVYKWIRTAAHREWDLLERQVAFDPFRETFDMVDTRGSTPERQVIAREDEIDLRALTAAVASQLSERQRDVLALWGADLTRPEIAERLGVKERIVKRDLLQVLDRARRRGLRGWQASGAAFGVWTGRSGRVFVALGGTTYAAVTITGRDVKDGSLTGKDIKRNSLTGKQIAEARLTDPVPRARNAAKLAGKSAASYLVRCPDGTMPLASVCIETQPRAATTYSTATSKCNITQYPTSPGRRLPRHDEPDQRPAPRADHARARRRAHEQRLPVEHTRSVGRRLDGHRHRRWRGAGPELGRRNQSVPMRQ